MTSLEDIGFRSFIARDVVGAVAVSSSEMWIGGALALGAVVGAVYAYPKAIADTRLTFPPSKYPHRSSLLFDPRLSERERESLAESIFLGRPLPESVEMEDLELRLGGLVPMAYEGPRSSITGVTYRAIGGLEKLPAVRFTVPAVAHRVMMGGRPSEAFVREAVQRAFPEALDFETQAIFLSENSRVRSATHRRNMGYEPVAERLSESSTYGIPERELIFAPSRCMLHRDCREHPDTVGRRCLMNQWDEEWKVGGRK